MPISIIEDSIPKDNEKVRIIDKVRKEVDTLSVCPQCKSCRLKVTLVINSCRLNVSKYKQKYEKYLEVEYFGPFTLFNKLRKFHKDELKGGSSKNPTSRFSGLLNEIGHTNTNYRLLQLDLKEMFVQQKDLYWNLIFRFIKDHRDYAFILPYEADLELSDLDETISSLYSEEDLIKPLYKNTKIPSNTTAKFGEVPMTAKASNAKGFFQNDTGNSTARGPPVYVDLSNEDNYVDQYVDQTRSKKKITKMKSKESRKSF